jgi:hypothetical protein
MSAKIGHGYRLKTGIEPFAFIARLREVMDPARDAADAKLLAGLYVDAVDNAWFSGEPIEEGAGYTAWRNWYLKQASMGSMDIDRDPNSFGVQIGQDPVTGGFYLLLLTDHEDLREAFRAMPEIEEYGYWDSNNSYPDGVTEADWKIREALWDRIIHRPGRTNLLTFNLRSAHGSGVRALLGNDGEDTSAVFASIRAEAERAQDAGGNAYSQYLVTERGIDPMRVSTHVVFGRSKQLSLVTDVAAAYLPAITAELVTEGSRGAVIDPGYTPAMKAACESLYELDKETLTR